MCPNVFPRGSKVRPRFLNGLNRAADWMLLLGNDVEVSTAGAAGDGMGSEQSSIPSALAQLTNFVLRQHHTHPEKKLTGAPRCRWTLLKHTCQTDFYSSDRSAVTGSGDSSHRLLPWEQLAGILETALLLRRYVILGKSHDAHLRPLIFPLYSQ